MNKNLFFRNKIFISFALILILVAIIAFYHFSFLDKSLFTGQPVVGHLPPQTAIFPTTHEYPFFAEATQSSSSGPTQFSFGQCDNLACTSFSSTPIDNVTNGQYISAVNAVRLHNGLRFMVYAMNPIGLNIIKVATCNNSACTAPTYATIVSSSSHYFTQPVVAIGADGNPVIAYFEEEFVGGQYTSLIKFVQCTTSTCTTHGPINYVDTTYVSTYYAHLSLAVEGNGAPVIAYTFVAPNISFANLKLAVCNNPPSCTSWYTKQFDNHWNSGSYPQIAILPSGFPALAHSTWNGALGQLLYIQCSDYLCQNPYNTAVLASGYANNNYRYGYISSIVGPDGNFIVAYRNLEANNQLSVTKCTTPSCSSVTISPIGTNSGYETGIAIGFDGNPIITTKSSNLQNYTQPIIIHCPTSDCSGSLDITPLNVQSPNIQPRAIGVAQ